MNYRPRDARTLSSFGADLDNPRFAHMYGKARAVWDRFSPNGDLPKEVLCMLVVNYELATPLKEDPSKKKKAAQEAA